MPTEDSARLALRTQQLLAYESGATKTVDPLAGSYYVEALTDKIEKEAAEYIARIDQLGGAAIAIEKGYLQAEMAACAYAYQREIETKERIVVGVNKFVNENEVQDGDYLRVDPVAGEKQRERLQELKANRDQAQVKKALAALLHAARGSENLMPYLIETVKTYATLGEICGVLREEFGEYKANLDI